MTAIGVWTWVLLHNSTYGFYEVKAAQLSMSVKRSTSESRITIRAAIAPEELIEISNRSDSNSLIYITIGKKYEPEDYDSSHDYFFNNKGFDYAQGGKSSTVEINGTKYITAVTPTARTLSRWISKDVQKLGAGYRTVYAVPIMDVIEWNPGDTLTDGTITSINLEFSANSATATIEVQ